MADLLPIKLSAGSGVTFGVDDLACAAATYLGLWEEQGLADLAELAAPLLELARRLERKELIEEAEIPDFIYAMH